MKKVDLIKKHGTLEEFSKACYRAVPSFISISEAEKGIKKYKEELEKAK